VSRIAARRRLIEDEDRAYGAKRVWGLAISHPLALPPEREKEARAPREDVS